MIKIKNICLSVLFGLCFFAEKSDASSMPSVDLKSVSVGLSLISPSISLDVPFTENFFTGVSLSVPVYYPGDLFGTLRYDLHFVYQLIKDHDSALSFGAIAGFWGDYNFSKKDYQNTWVAFQAGVGISYKFTNDFTGRLNLVAAIPSSEYGLIAPSAGVELIYTPRKNLELSLGITGQGDFLGAKWKF